MKYILLLSTLCTALACQAAEPDATAATPAASPASAAAKSSKGRCPPPRVDMLRKMPAGDFKFVIRSLVKADGSIENVRVEGGLASREAKRVARDMFADRRCLPAEADQEYVDEFSLKTTVH